MPCVFIDGGQALASMDYNYHSIKGWIPIFVTRARWNGIRSRFSDARRPGTWGERKEGDEAGRVRSDGNPNRSKYTQPPTHSKTQMQIALRRMNRGVTFISGHGSALWYRAASDAFPSSAPRRHKEKKTAPPNSDFCRPNADPVTPSRLFQYFYRRSPLP